MWSQSLIVLMLALVSGGQSNPDHWVMPGMVRQRTGGLVALDYAIAEMPVMSRPMSSDWMLSVPS
jgi:hypothetical protein